MSPRALSHLTLRGLRRISSTIGVVLVFAIACVVSLVLHTNVPVVRSVAAQLIASAFNKTFYGSIEIESFDRIEPNRLRASRATIFDESGTDVLRGTGLNVHIEVVDTLEKIFSNEEKLSIVISHIRLEQVDAQVLFDEAIGSVTLERAFTPRPDEEKKEDKEPSRPVRVWMPNVEIGKGFARVELGQGPTFETSVANAKGSVLVSPKGVAVDVQRFSTTVRGFAGADVRGTGTLTIRVPGKIETHFSGFLGDVEVQAIGELVGDELALDLSLPHAKPSHVRALLPEWPLLVPVAGRIEARGRLPDLQVQSQFRVRDAQVEIGGPLSLSDTPTAQLDVQTHDFDLRSLASEAPATTLDAMAKVDIGSDQGSTQVQINGHVEPSEILGQSLPRIDVSGSAGVNGFVGEVRALDAGTSVKAHVIAAPNGDLDVEADIPNLELGKHPRLPRGAEGVADLHLVGKLRKGTFEGSAHADVKNLHVEQLNVQSAKVKLRARGPASTPEKWALNTSVQAQALSYANFEVANVDATAAGHGLVHQVKATLKDPDGRTARVDGRLNLDPLQIHDMDIEVRHRRLRLVGKIQQLDPAAREIIVRDIQLSGAQGRAEGSLVAQPGLLELELDAEDLNLRRLLRALGIHTTIRGKLTAKGSIAVGSDLVRGRMQASLSDGYLNSELGPVDLTARVELRDREIDTDIQGETPLLDSFSAHLAGQLAGTPLELASWTNATGKADVQLRKIDLVPLGLLLPKDSPVDKIGGYVNVAVSLHQTSPGQRPNLFFQTTGNQLQFRYVDRQEEEQEAFMFEDWTVHVSGGLNGSTGDLTGSLLTADAAGQQLNASGAMKLDIDRLLAEPSQAASQLLSAPVDGVVTIPERALSALPAPLRPEYLAGSIGGRVSVKGSLSKPTIFATLSANDLVEVGSRHVEPVNALLHGEYSFASHIVDARVEATHSGRRVATARVNAFVPLEEGKKASGQVAMDLTGLPLSIFSQFADSQTAGLLHGQAYLSKLEDRSEIAGDLEVRQLAIARSALGRGTLKLSGTARKLAVDLGLHSKTDEVQGQLVIHTNEEYELTSVEVDVDARRFTIAALAPVVEGVVSRLGGTLDAKFRGQVIHNLEHDDWQAQIRGSGAVLDGTAFIDALGLELQNISLAFSADPIPGGTRLSFSDVSAKARSPESGLRGSAQLRLEGASVTSGDARIAMEELPLSLKGVSWGTATGAAQFELERMPGYLLVRAKIPTLLVKLPKTASRDLIDLGDNPDIQIVQSLKRLEDEDPGRWRFVFELGNIRLKRGNINIPLTGRPIVELGKTPSTSGTITLIHGGRIPILGKVFLVEHGRITLNPQDSSNPFLDILATWRSSSGLTVNVSVTGTLDNPEAHFSSPSVDESQVLNLLLGTDSTGAGGEGPEGDTAQAGAVVIGGSVAELALNELLGDTLGEWEFRISPSSENASYTAAVRLDDNLWLETSYRHESTSSAAGTPTDVISGALDYRFTRKWSLRTELGNAGGSLDLLWQHRY